MRQAIEYRSIIGAFIWVVLIALGIVLVRQSIHRAPDAFTELSHYVGRQRRIIRLESNYNLALRIGDPVYLADSDEVSPIGSVSRIELAKDGYLASEIEVAMFGSAPVISEQDHFEFHYAPDSSEWLVRTMLTDEKKDRIRKLIEGALEDHRDEIFAAFQPVLEDSLDQARELIQQDLNAAIESRKEQLTAIGDRYREQLLKKEFVPLFQDELWPIIQEDSEPLMTEISQEIWKEVSVFSFGWRYLYDRSPLPEKKLTEKKFRQFMDEKAKPIIESHVDDFVDLQQKLATKITQNEKFKATVSKSMTTIASDPEIKALLTDVFREVFVENKRLHEAMEQQWNTPKAQQALRLANSKLDPTIREIGVTLFGTPKGGITPEFAKVLRRRILHKDSKWLTLHIADPEHNASIDRDAPFPETLPVLLSVEDTTIPTAVK